LKKFSDLIGIRTRYLSPCNIMPQPTILFFFILSAASLSSFGAAANIGLLYLPQMTGDGDCGAVDGMKFGSGNRNTRRKLVPLPLCPP
jgi:hypothetical protein